MSAPAHSGEQCSVGLEEVSRFLYMEARLQDEHRYEEWEQLWSADALYWVPAGGDDVDPLHQVSIIYDNRDRIGSRVRQLCTGRRIAQAPPSRLRRIVGNIELEGFDRGSLKVGSNFILSELHNGRARIWSGRVQHVLQPAGPSFKMSMKKVMLLDNDLPLPTLAFLV